MFYATTRRGHADLLSNLHTVALTYCCIITIAMQRPSLSSCCFVSSSSCYFCLCCPAVSIFVVLLFLSVLSCCFNRCRPAVSNFVVQLLLYVLSCCFSYCPPISVIVLLWFISVVLLFVSLLSCHLYLCCTAICYLSLSCYLYLCCPVICTIVVLLFISVLSCCSYL